MTNAASWTVDPNALRGRIAVVAGATRGAGRGIARQVDHLDPLQVERLADFIRDDYGHIDLLVNDIWGGERLKGPPPEWNRPLWQHDLERGFRILRLAIDTHITTAYFLLPLLVGRPGGRHVEVTDGTAAYNESHTTVSRCSTTWRRCR